MIDFLADWSPAASRIQEQVMELYGLLYERDHIRIIDVRMVELWLIKLAHAGYIIPKSCKE